MAPVARLRTMWASHGTGTLIVSIETLTRAVTRAVKGWPDRASCERAGGLSGLPPMRNILGRLPFGGEVLSVLTLFIYNAPGNLPIAVRALCFYSYLR